jgi:Flagellar transcriptional activator (FlhC)
MSTPYIDTHIKRLALAREAAQLGARHKAVAALSCLPYSDVARLLRRGDGKCSRGMPPTGDNWASEAPLLCRIEAAIFCNLFERLRIAGYGSSVSMVTAYREFSRNYQPMIHERKRIERGQSEDMLTFDRAFHLVANLRVSCPSDRALWLRPDPKYTLATCPKCGARSVKDVTDVLHCPLCRLVQRLKYDRRVQHLMSSAETHRSAFRAMLPLKAFADLIALRSVGMSQPPPAVRPDVLAASASR